MTRLNGQIGWVTGAGSGIGAAGAKKLAREGMHVILSGRRTAPLEKIAQSIRDDGGSAEIAPLDVTDQKSVEEVAKDIIKRFGRLDLLVNSAGLNVKERSWEQVNAEGWNRVVNADLNGAFYCCAAVLPTMRQQKEGLIINVSSWAGVHPSRLTGPAYTAAKHGMVAMNESLNIEEGINGIRACALCPGEVATEILDARPIPPSQEDRDRMLQDEDLGDTILFVATLPARACVNTLIISPTWNRSYIHKDL
ncbi:SDR family oxidoreductase [Sneathiella sp.]|jgi:NADP-dependent 3-hydroxy acid dehydrogenase YdfG|uniref:SDR family oxidoreductase n=1 Tax=Sneathiella sp. TaxID=1964365 RepID=UPI0039E458E7